MQKWEYKNLFIKMNIAKGHEQELVIDPDDITNANTVGYTLLDYLNSLGNEGWELIYILDIDKNENSNKMLLLKRQKHK